MRPWRGIDANATNDPRVREAFLSINEFLHDLSASIKSLGQGQEPVASGGTTVGVSDGDKGDIIVTGSGGTWTIDATGAASATTFLSGTRAWSTPDHGSLGGLADDDHAQYLALTPASISRATGQAITDHLSVTSNASGSIPLTLNGGSNSAISVQRWQNQAADTTLDLKVVGGGTPAVSLYTDVGTGLQLYTGGTSIGIQMSSTLIQFTGAKGGYGTGTSALFNVDAANMSATVVDGDDNLRIIRRASTQTGKAINFMEQTRTTTLFSVTKDGYVSTPQLLLNGATSGTLTLVPAAATTNHTETWPAANASGVLTNNGSGTLSWAAAGSNALLDGSVHTDTTNSACTRGDIVYGNSSAQWDDLAIGSSNTVLRSNGTDPSWGAIDKAYISDRTRSFFIPPESFSTVARTNVGTIPDLAQKIACSGTADTSFTTWITVPDDYASTPEFIIYYASTGVSTNNTAWDIWCKTCSAGTDITAGYDTTSNATSAPPGTANVMVQIGSLLTGATLTAGEPLRLSVRRSASSDANDTNTDQVSFCGVKFSYTADM